MNNSRIDASAKIHWLNKSEGGRNNPPNGSVFGANLHFENDETIWSVVVLQNIPPDGERNQLVNLGFLFRENLEEKLEIGKKIYILEGPVKILAEGIIISVNPS